MGNMYDIWKPIAVMDVIASKAVSLTRGSKQNKASRAKTMNIMTTGVF
jgi:hypothetical protein